MHKAKAWLHSQGHIATAGRGRPPAKSMKDGRDISAILLEATKSGVKFSDWPKGKVEVTNSPGTESKVVVTRSVTVPNSNAVADIAPYRFPEDKFEAYEFVNGKKKRVSLRECCNTCRVSLVAHKCEEPTYLNFQKVYIVPKK